MPDLGRLPTVFDFRSSGHTSTFRHRCHSLGMQHGNKPDRVVTPKVSGEKTEIWFDNGLANGSAYFDFETARECHHGCNYVRN